MDEVEIRHEPGQGFTAEVEGHRILLDYRLSDGVMAITHTEVPHALRGRGLAAPAMAGVVEYILADYATASLYVNDFNVRAIRCYQRVGFTEVGRYASVLF